MTDFQVEEDVCNVFSQSFPEEHLTRIKQEELLSLFSLGSFVLLLGKCCRGWGAEDSLDRVGTNRKNETSKTRLHLHSESFKVPVIAEPPSTPQRQLNAPDPLQKYKSAGESRRGHTVVVPHRSPARGMRKATMGGKLDLGSFLIGVDVSLRDDEPRMAQGLFAPLSNGNNS